MTTAGSSTPSPRSCRSALPWTDDFEQGAGDWTVMPAEGSESDWTLGYAGRGRPAHSPSSCWGSNLGGGPLGLAESVLVSPGIFLAGGNEATLRFWQNYDFPAGRHRDRVR